MLDYFNPGDIKYNKALFLDRDGTVIVDKVMAYKAEDLIFFKDSFKALRKAAELEAYIIIITNQSGIALGRYTVEEMERYNSLMINRLADEGIRINAVLYCPHYDKKNFPAGYQGCGCSKPEPGLLYEAQKLLGFNLTESVLIGDKHTDIGAGIKACCKASILVTTGIYKHGSYDKEELAAVYKPEYVASSLSEAVDMAAAVL